MHGTFFVRSCHRVLELQTWNTFSTVKRVRRLLWKRSLHFWWSWQEKAIWYRESYWHQLGMWYNWSIHLFPLFQVQKIKYLDQWFFWYVHCVLIYPRSVVALNYLELVRNWSIKVWLTQLNKELTRSHFRMCFWTYLFFNIND